jgi:hypothetical protein
MTIAVLRLHGIDDRLVRMLLLDLNRFACSAEFRVATGHVPGQPTEPLPQRTIFRNVAARSWWLALV